MEVGVWEWEEGEGIWEVCGGCACVGGGGGSVFKRCVLDGVVFLFFRAGSLLFCTCQWLCLQWRWEFRLCLLLDGQWSGVVACDPGSLIRRGMPVFSAHAWTGMGTLSAKCRQRGSETNVWTAWMILRMLVAALSLQLCDCYTRVRV